MIYITKYSINTKDLNSVLKRVDKFTLQNILLIPAGKKDTKVVVKNLHYKIFY